MNTTTTARRQGRPPERCAIRPVAAACALLLLSTGAAVAQDAKPADAQSVTVTGIRRAIETSVATKRNSDSIVEAVSSEDLGKLPDASIAEALARLPGLTGQRGSDGRLMHCLPLFTLHRKKIQTIGQTTNIPLLIVFSVPFQSIHGNAQSVKNGC